FAGGADQRRLLVFGVFSEHAPIVLNFCHFEEGRSTLFAVESHLEERKTQTGIAIRIISCRKATMAERKLYEEDR
ncbi:MAG: hypothetical protein AB1846_19905, partial [Chloroflexota bacterium]